MFDKAIEKFEKATKINPQIVDYHASWGIALFNLGKYDKAIEPFKKAIEIDPHNTNVFYYLGISYSKVGQKDDAVKIFRHVLELKPEASINNDVNKLLHDLTKKE
jgi:tetratricopeptide (TPR) repeat protein